MELLDIFRDKEKDIESMSLDKKLQSCFEGLPGCAFALLDTEGRFLTGAPVHNEILRRIVQENRPGLGSGKQSSVCRKDGGILYVTVPVRLQDELKGFAICEADIKVWGGQSLQAANSQASLEAFLVAPMVCVIDACCRLKEALDEKLILKTRVRHLTNSMDVLREQHQEIQSINLQQCEELEEKNESLEGYGRNLEQKVSERTLELEHAKEKAEESDKLKSEFLANMSHEMRTPLNAIIGFVEMVLEEKLTAAQRDYLEIVYRNSRLLLNLINDILDLSKLQARQMGVEHIPTCLNALLDEALSNAGSLMAGLGKQLEVEISIDSDIKTPVLSDPKRLRQIMNNLVGNAVKFTESGKIEIGVKPGGESELIFHVRDSGIGIPTEKQELIFRSFKQADGSTTRNYGGTGLGLTITRQLVELLGGSIWVESAEGRGSAFYFSHPHRPCEPSDTAVVIEKPASAPAAPCLKIFLVDDSRDNLLLAKTILEKNGHAVVTAGDGKEAVERYRSQPDHFDLILMDIQMPGMGGLEATALIRRQQEQGRLKKIPIIALTAGAMEGDRLACLEAGCDDYLNKPIDKERLLALLQKYASGMQTNESKNKLSLETARITVVVDPDLQDLIPGYLGAKKKDIANMRDALVENDYETIRFTGHSMKGSGAGYGFDFISDIGRAIEKAARQQNSEIIQEKLAELESCLSRVDFV